MTTTLTQSETFTIIHARHVSSKVGADLELCRLYYGRPSTEWVPQYIEELAQLLKGRFVEQYEFGFKHKEVRILCWRYSFKDDGSITTDDHPGKIDANAEIKDSVYYNFLTYNFRWFLLPDAEREAIQKNLPFRRGDGSLPSDGSGYWTTDRSYSSGGIGTARQTFRRL